MVTRVIKQDKPNVIKSIETVEAYEYIYQYPLKFSPMEENISKKVKCYGIESEKIEAKMIEFFANKFNLPKVLYIPSQFYDTNMHKYRNGGTFKVDVLEFVPFIENEQFYMMIIVSNSTSGQTNPNVDKKVYSFSRYVYPIEYDEKLIYCDSFVSACGSLMERFHVSLPGGHAKIEKAKD